MGKITGQAEKCLQRAATCRMLAEDAAFDSVAREHFAEMAQRWAELAESYRLAEEVSGYIEWQARRVDPPWMYTPADD